MNIKKQIGQRIQIERKSKGLTQAELARLAGDLKQPRINNWENGLRTPGLEEVKEIARVLEVSPAYLMCITDRKTLHPLDKNHLAGLAPLLSQKQACDPDYWVNAVKKEEYGDDIDFIPIGFSPQRNFEANIFAIEVNDESMQPDLLQGDILIIEPGRAPRPGNLVLAVINENETIVRRYRQLSPNNLSFELQATNAHWPHVRNEEAHPCKLLGVVIQLVRSLVGS